VKKIARVIVVVFYLGIGAAHLVLFVQGYWWACLLIDRGIDLVVRVRFSNAH
jgi:hypothetical protein